MCSTAWPLSLLLFLLCPVEKGSWCFYHDGCSKVGILSFLFCQPIAPWHLPSVSVCALHVFHSLTTIPAAVSALSRWERQLMLLCRYLLKSWYSFFFILSTRLDTDTFPPPLFGSPCVPQLDHDPCRSFCFAPLRKAADASIMVAAQR